MDLDVRQSVGRPSHEDQVSTVAASREAGDTAWFSDAVVAILPELYGTARRLTKNAADAELGGWKTARRVITRRAVTFYTFYD